MNLIIEKTYVGHRLDCFLPEYFGNEAPGGITTRSGYKRLIDDGLVLVNGKVQKCGFKLREGDYLSINFPEVKEICAKEQDIPLDVVYEDEDLLVVNKPKGLVVHLAPGHYEGTLVNALLHHCKGSLSGINGELRPGIVHRIDKDTSGLLVVAKNNNTHNMLSEQFARHSITRAYEAIALGIVKEDMTVSAPIGRHPKDRKKMAVVADGRCAVTHISVLDQLKKHTHIRACLETGRTHQIRVHLSYIHHPILGDSVYGHESSLVDGQALHARTLGFIHPNGKYMEFTSDLPEYFTKALAKL